MKKQEYLNDLEINLNYLEHGLKFEELNYDESLSDYIYICFPKDSEKLLEHLPPFQTLQFLKNYYDFSSDLKRKIFKEMLYSLVLLIMGLLLSYFYVYRFEPSIRSLLIDYGTNVSMLNRYRILLQGLIIVMNTFVMFLVLVVFMIQSKDLKIMINVILLGHSSLYKKLISYQYTMMLLLFMQFDMKTSDMVSFLREASIGDINKWLLYHVESQLSDGLMIHECFEIRYFDQYLIDFMALGYHHQDVYSYLNKYCAMSSKDLDVKIKKIARFFKMFVFSYLVIIVAIFYSTLYLPLQLLEVL